MRRTSGSGKSAFHLQAMPMACIVILCLASVAAQLSCASNTVRSDVVYEDSYKSYERVLKNWTREARIYEGLETTAIFTATYLSRNFREAYAAEYSRSKGYSMDKAQNLIEKSLEEHRRVNLFHLAVYTPQKDLNDLDRRPSSWNVYLLTADGVKVEVERIQKLTVRPFAMRGFYPYLNEWTDFYEVSFQRILPETEEPVIREDRGEFSLVISGVLGRADMRWRLERPSL